MSYVSLTVNNLSTTTALSLFDSQITVATSGSSVIPLYLLPFAFYDINLRTALLNKTANIFNGVSTITGNSALSHLQDNFCAGSNPMLFLDPEFLLLTGRGFCFTTTTSLTSGNAYYVTIQNPSTSPISARLLSCMMTSSSTTGTIIINIFANPVAGTGSTVTPLNILVGSPVASQLIVQEAVASVTADGALLMTLMSNAPTNNNPFGFNNSLILAPGNSILIEVTGTNFGALASLNANLYLQWGEQ